MLLHQCGSGPLRLAFRLGEVWSQLDGYLADRHPVLQPLLDPHTLFVSVVALHLTWLVLLKQAANIAARNEQKQAQAQTQKANTPAASSSSSAAAAAAVSPPPESSSLLLQLAQHHMMALIFLYAHLFHRGALDHAVSHPIGLVCAATLLVHLALTRWLGASRGLLPVALGQRLLRTWQRWLFLLPEDPALIVWSALGYCLARWALPATTGSGQTGWGWDATRPGLDGTTVAAAAKEERAGGELCAYSWRAVPLVSLESGAALRSCPDLSFLCLVYAGVLWPLVEFARLLIVRCAKLHEKPSQPDALPSAPRASESTRAHAHASSDAQDCDECDDDDEDDPRRGRGATDVGSVSLLARVASFSLMSTGCMLATWVLGIGALALTHHAASILPADESACPAPLGAGGSGAYEREVSVLQSRGGGSDCALQWSRVQNALMWQYASFGLLAGLFGFVSNPLPPALRLHLLVPLCVALWKGSVMPACIVVATRCIG